jgi:2-keto-3-deoxy-L-rhamnonate aldolase RhmA
VIANPVKKALKKGEAVKGLNIFESLRPSVIKIATQAAFDFIMVDTEHVVHNNETLTNFLVLARDNNLAPLVTVVSPDRALVSRMLDAGALGIVLSHADTAEQVEDLVRWAKYAPEGERGLALGANADYDASDVAGYCQAANEAILVIPKIESALGVRNIDSIVSVVGVDGIVFGPGDLAATMGLHGQWEHPEVLTAIETVISAALARGLAVEPAVMPANKADYKQQRKRGLQIFGTTRCSEYNLLQAATLRAMEPYQ